MNKLQRIIEGKPWLQNVYYLYHQSSQYFLMNLNTLPHLSLFSLGLIILPR